MNIKEILEQVEYKDGKIVSKNTGNSYTVSEFSSQVAKTYKWSARQRRELERQFTEFLRPQTEKSEYIEKLIERYDLKFADGVYMMKGRIIALEDIYRSMWSSERLLPCDVDDILENVEKISPTMSLQDDIFDTIKSKSVKGRSVYLDSLRELYPKVPWTSILHNILCPSAQPMFHIFYDDGVGGTGKSTLLEVLTMIVGEKFVSNVLLDQFGNRFMFANMLGKYLNIGDDNGRNDELANVGTLKSIVTGNRVTVDRKNIAPIEVRIFAKQLFATNILPYIDFTDGGLMRRLNIINMNVVIPSHMKLPVFDKDEIGHIIYEALAADDLDSNSNYLAIENSPLYRFITTSTTKAYGDYQTFCLHNGFRCMNVINFEVKSKFVNHYLEKKKKTATQPFLVAVDDLPW